MYFRAKSFTIAYTLLSAGSLVWMAQFHPFAILSGILIVAALFFREKVQLGNRSLGLVVVIGLLLCFFCTRLLDPRDNGLFLGIGTMSLALLASWLLTFSLLLRKTGYLKRAPLILASAVIILCSMSVHFESVIYIAALAVIVLVGAMRESLNLRTSVRHLAPLIATLALMASLAMVARWSESKVSYLMGLFSLMPPSGIDFPATSSLGALQRWNNSDVVVLRGYGADPPQYLVGRSFSKFDQNSFWRWETTKEELAPQDQVLLNTKRGSQAISLFNKSDDPDAKAGPVFRMEYPRSGNGLTLYLPRTYYGVAADLSQIHAFSDGMMQALAKDHLNGEYFIFPFSDGWEKTIPAVALTETERQGYLALPEKLTPEIGRLADEIAGQVESPERKAEFITSYLQQNFTYGYDYPFESSQSALEEFLLKRPPVHCEFFATAAALMLRSEGVPTRYINGFVLQEKSLTGDYYVVRLKHAHAWVEAYIPERGWVTYDPTPPGTLGEPDDSPGLGAALLEWFSDLWRRFIDFFSLSPAEMIEKVKAVVTRLTVFDYLKIGLLLGLWWVWKRYRSGRLRKRLQQVPADVYTPQRDDRLTPILEAAVEQVQPLNWQRKLAETPREWLKRLQLSNLDAKSLEQLEAFLAKYTELRFGQAESESELEELERLLEGVKSEFKGKSLEPRRSTGNPIDNEIVPT